MGEWEGGGYLSAGRARVSMRLIILPVCLLGSSESHYLAVCWGLSVCVRGSTLGNMRMDVGVGVSVLGGVSTCGRNYVILVS